MLLISVISYLLISANILEGLANKAIDQKDAISMAKTKQINTLEEATQFCNQVFPGFIKSIIFNYQHLSSRQIELIILYKTGLSKEKIALIQGINPGSVSKAKKRLENSIDEWETLEEFINSDFK